MRLRRTTLAAVAVASIGLLGACTSQPSPKAVVKDVIESLPDLSDAERTCMLEVVDAMSSDELEQIGDDNLDVAISSSNTGDEAMTAFIDRLSDCRTEG